MGFKRVPKFDPEAILSAALECMADDLARQRCHSGRAALELASYRHEFDRLQSSFTRLEAHIGRQTLLGATEIFEYPADSSGVVKPSAPTQPSEGGVQSGAGVTQYVPVDSFGFSSFSIYIKGKPKTAADPLRIALQAIETGRTYGTWHISPGQAPVGWLELALESAVDEPALSLVIAVEWPEHPDEWALALGPPHPYREFCVRTEAGQYLPAPLALRVFGRLPGVHVQATTSAIRPVDAPHALTQFIPYQVYATVAQVVPRADEEKPALVSYDSNIGCITVHPRSGGLITAGRINVVVPKNAWRLSAQIHLGHEQASSTQFGLLICTPQKGLFAVEALDQMTGDSPGFSGWKMLSPLEKKSISVLLAPSRQEPLAVYLATRQAPDSSPDFGWARFTKFEFNILPASLLSENQTDAMTSIDVIQPRAK
jgi:hypothetical protein